MSEASSIAMGGGGVADAAVAIPVRYWWLKRIGIAAGVMVFLLGAMRWYWGVEAERRLQTEIARIQAAGEPIYPEDFDPPEEVSNDENAAWSLQKAQGLLSVNQVNDLTILDLTRWPSMIEEQLGDVAKIVDANREVLRLLREARAKPDVDWGIRLRRPVITFLLPSLAGVRSLVKFGRVVATYDHLRGNDAAAVARLLDAMHCGRAVDRMNGLLVAHLVALSCYSQTAQAVEDLAPTLAVRAAGSSMADSSAGAERESVLALIGEFLDDNAMRDAWRSAMHGERTCQLDTVLALAEGDITLGALTGAATGGPGKLFGWGVGFVLGPVLKLDGLYMLERGSKRAAAGLESTLPAARRNWPPEEDTHGGIARTTRAIISIMERSLDRALVLHFRMAADLRLAGTALAIRLFELDHGERPARLSLLVPDYLPAVPLDPFADDGREIGYLPDARKAILYSVGLNGIDDGGEYELRWSGGVYWEAKDMPFFLDGDRPRAKREKEIPTGSPVEGDEEGGDVEEHGGEGDEDGGGGEEP